VVATTAGGGASCRTVVMSPLVAVTMLPSSNLILALPALIGRVSRLPVTLITWPVDPFFSSTVAPGATLPKVSTSSPLSVPTFMNTRGVSDGGGSLLMSSFYTSNSAE